MEERYDLIFKGELVKGADIRKTKMNLAQLFKISNEKVEALFSGNAIVLKRGLSLDAANKYRVAIKKSGARVDLLAQKQKSQTPVDAPQEASSRAVESPPQADKAPSRPSEQVTAGAAFELAPVGSDLLRPEEKSKKATQPVDTGELALEPMEGYLVALGEQKKEPALDIVPGSYGISAVGDDLLKPEERKKWVPAEVDVSSITIAQPGAQLSTLKAPAPPRPPDTSGIQLQK